MKINTIFSSLKINMSIFYTYIVKQDNHCVYTGPKLEFLVNDLVPFTSYCFRMQLMTVENGEKSEMSEISQETTDESVPSEPTNLRVLGSTATVIKIAWDAPEDLNGIFKTYFVFKDNNLVDQTTETTFIFGGLHAGTTYELQVSSF